MFDRCLPKFEKFIYILVVYSVIMFFVEADIGGKDSLQGPIFFLWSERFVAFVLTFEVVMRFWFHSPHTKVGTDGGYFKSPEMVIDLISVVPFWIGFIVPAEYLPAVRSMRILRLLKFYRMSPVAHLVVHNLIDQIAKIRMVSGFVFIIILFSGTIMHHLEGDTQEAFSTLWGSIWWAVITVTTLGYGDMFPTTKPGQLVTMLLMIPSIGVVGAMISIIGDAFNIDKTEVSTNMNLSSLIHTNRHGDVI